MTPEELIQKYSELENIDYSQDYAYFNRNYKAEVLTNLQGKELAARFFATKTYGDKVGARGYFCWAEFGSQGRPPLGTAKLGSTKNIQYDGKSFFITQNKTTTEIDENTAVECAENIRTVFTETTNVIKNYIAGNRLNDITGYQELNNDLLKLLHKPNYIREYNRECLCIKDGFTSFLIKYFHCTYKDYFAFGYSKDSLLKIFNSVIEEQIVAKQALLLSGQLSLYAKRLGIYDNDRFGVLLYRLLNTSTTLLNVAKERKEQFQNWLKRTGKKNGENYTDNTINTIVSGLSRVWKYINFQEKRSSPFDYGEKDIEEFGRIKDSLMSLSFWTEKRDDIRKDKQLSLIDNDCKIGLNKYYEFLQNKNYEEKSMNEQNKIDVAKDTAPKNIILYGPPGTGKTYNTVIKAVKIIDGNADANYDLVLKRYRELVEQGRIAFTTFHQSYGYEEFIEGIKPDFESDSTDIKYKVADGVFKTFCNKAKKPKNSLAQQYGTNEASVIWKVSLGGAADSQIKEDCFKNDKIRIGWGDGYTPQDAETNEYTGDGKRIVNAFINEMKKGDIVFSFASAEEIDAIGIIKEDAAKYNDDVSKYKWYRNVEWIKTNKTINIKELNSNKRMVQPAVYKLSVTLENALSLMEDSNTELRENYDYSEPYVFIIDEINRGNISKIFGELITLIEPSKRLGEKEEMTCFLPYSGKPFGVPKNVYIIGTMNTADRSIQALDTALRRRFHFVEMMPDTDILQNITEIDGINIVKMLETMNKRITVLYDREHTIGHAYFIPLKSSSKISTLADIFKNKIIPLLQEYFYDDYEKIRLVLGDCHKKDGLCFIKKDNTSFTDLFGVPNEDTDEPPRYLLDKRRRI